MEYGTFFPFYNSYVRKWQNSGC